MPREGSRGGGVVRTMQEAARLVGDGDRVVYVGYMKMEPVAFFHELLRQGRRGLHLVLAPSSGYVADMMIGAGALADIEFSSLSFMEYGFAPNFRRRAEAGLLQYREHS
jgi:glutaconate CoA-transferase subunit A